MFDEQQACNLVRTEEQVSQCALIGIEAQCEDAWLVSPHEPFHISVEPFGAVIGEYQKARDTLTPCAPGLAIGVAEPVSIRVDTFGTGTLDDSAFDRLVRKHFDLTPRGIITSLDLLRPSYRATSYHGHFGRENAGLPWEETGVAEKLAADAAR